MKGSRSSARMAELSESAAPFVLVTINEVRGLRLRHVDARMPLLGDRTTDDTTGRGVSGRQMIADAQTTSVLVDARAVFGRPRADGVSEERLSRIDAPISLGIGFWTPTEPAPRIIPETVVAQDGRGGPLRVLLPSPSGSGAVS